MGFVVGGRLYVANGMLLDQVTYRSELVNNAPCTTVNGTRAGITATDLGPKPPDAVLPFRFQAI